VLSNGIFVRKGFLTYISTESLWENVQKPSANAAWAEPSTNSVTASSLVVKRAKPKSPNKNTNKKPRRRRVWVRIRQLRTFVTPQLGKRSKLKSKQFCQVLTL
jgi:hypothetical protein